MDELDNFIQEETTSLDSFLDSIPEPRAGKEPKQPKFIFQYDENGCIKLTPQRIAELRAIERLSEDTCASFDEWKSCGYWILKGSKSHFTDILGVPQFTIEQVRKGW